MRSPDPAGAGTEQTPSAGRRGRRAGRPPTRRKFQTLPEISSTVEQWNIRFGSLRTAPLLTSPIVLLKKGVHEGIGVERAQVVFAFAGTDEADGKAQIVRDGEDDTALRRAVELGEGDGGDIDRIRECLSLDEGVLANSRV